MDLLARFSCGRAALTVGLVLVAAGVVSACARAPAKPLITGGDGGASVEKAVERRNAADLDIPPQVDMQELPPAAPK